MKRKLEQAECDSSQPEIKRRAVRPVDDFREGLFDEHVLDSYTKSYANSAP